MTGVKRSESLNGSAVFIRALADIASNHLKNEGKVSRQLMLRCPGCTNEACKHSKDFFKGDVGGLSAISEALR